ncbi:hypothetical protein AtDm6_3541 [Acetobacter tropicalis]|uniref:Uncharacterized protein n=1 Tax=Acetobacter tropicalis TaxID=104102 RepID=A0A094YHI2_9PROT|nr:hypothetical protein AtDm6_3541 [Acetobacter tropicalis]
MPSFAKPCRRLLPSSLWARRLSAHKVQFSIHLPSGAGAAYCVNPSGHERPYRRF